MSVRSRNYKIIIQRDSNALTTRVIQLLDAGDAIYDARDTAVAAAASASASATQAEGIVTSAQDTIDQAVEAAQTAQEAAEAAMSAVVSPFVEGVIGTYNADHPSQNQIILRGSFAGKQAIDLNLGYGADQYPSGFTLTPGSDADGEYTVISPASGDWPIGMAFYARGVYRSASDPAEAADRAEAAAQAAEAVAGDEIRVYPSGDSLTALNEAATTAVTSGRVIVLGSGVFSISARWTLPDGVQVRGQGRDKTIIRVTGNDRVVVMGVGCSIQDVTIDGTAQTGTPELSALQVKSGCSGSRLHVTGAYSNIAFDGVGAHLNDVLTDFADSRGVIFGQGSSFNSIRGLVSQDNGNAAVIFGQGAHDNAVYDLDAKRINSAAIWFSDGAYNNVVDGGFVSSPTNPDANVIVFGSSSRNNTVRGIKGSGYRRAVIMTSGPVVAGPEASGNLFGNVVENCDFVGLGAAVNTFFAVTFSRTDTSLVDEAVIRDCTFSDYYGGLENASTAVQNVNLSDLRFRNIGAGGPFGKMKGTSGTARVVNVPSALMRRRYLSDPFDIATTGDRTIVIPHGLPYTPPLSSMQVTLQRETTVTDFRVDYIWPVATTTTDVTVRVRMGVASATAGATARVSLMIDMQAENGFALNSLT